MPSACLCQAWSPSTAMYTPYQSTAYRSCYKTTAVAELQHAAASNTPLFTICVPKQKRHKALSTCFTKNSERLFLSNAQSMLLLGVQVCTMYPRLSLADQTQPGSTECCLLWLAQRKLSNSCRCTSSGWGGVLWYASISLHANMFAAHSRALLYIMSMADHR